MRLADGHKSGSRCARGPATCRLQIEGARASATSWNAHLAQLLRGGSWFNDPPNGRTANLNSNHPHDNTHNGLRPCCPSTSAPFTLRGVGNDSRGSARRGQPRSGDRRTRLTIRTTPVHCLRPHVVLDLQVKIGHYWNLKQSLIVDWSTTSFRLILPDG